MTKEVVIPILVADDGTTLPFTVENLYRIATETHPFCEKSPLGGFLAGMMSTMILHGIMTAMPADRAAAMAAVLQASLEETVTKLMQGTENANASDTIRPDASFGHDPRYH